MTPPHVRGYQWKENDMNGEYIKISNIFDRDTTTKKIVEGAYTKAEFEYLKDCEWVATEKVDGTNIRVIWDGYRVSFKGRTDKADIPKPLLERLEELFGGESNEEIFEKLFENKEVVLYGEGYGGKIQGDNGYGKVNFILFDVWVNGYWLEHNSVRSIATSFGIKIVPTMKMCTLTEAVEFIKTHPKSMLRDGEVEGVVCKPRIPMVFRDGTPIIVKIKCRDF